MREMGTDLLAFIELLLKSCRDFRVRYCWGEEPGCIELAVDEDDEGEIVQFRAEFNLDGSIQRRGCECRGL